MLLKRLSEASGLPGLEGEVRAIIVDELGRAGVSYRTDPIGNVISEPSGARLGPHIMVAAHMDEIGLLISGFEASGLLRFQTIGGVDQRVLVSKVVSIGGDGVRGVIGAKAVHLQEHDEVATSIRVSDLYVDIGAASKEEAQKCVKLGDGAVFVTKYEETIGRMAKGKAFDDRAGCAVLLDALGSATADGLNVSGAFTVQEEVGTRGAWVSAYSIDPDVAVVIECTSAADVPSSPEHQCPTSLGNGPAISFMDKGLIVPPKLSRALIETAEALGMPFQLKQATSGGTDGGRIHTSRKGVPTVVISIPCRYIHSPASIMSLADYEAVGKLLTAFLRRLHEGGVPV